MEKGRVSIDAWTAPYSLVRENDPRRDRKDGEIAKSVGILKWGPFYLESQTATQAIAPGMDWRTRVVGFRVNAP